MKKIKYMVFTDQHSFEVEALEGTTAQQLMKVIEDSGGNLHANMIIRPAKVIAIMVIRPPKEV